LLTALSSLRDASRSSVVANSPSPVAAASLNLRIAVFSDDLTALLRRRRFSFCLLRLICDLMFATRQPRPGSSDWCFRARNDSASDARRVRLPGANRSDQNAPSTPWRRRVYALSAPRGGWTAPRSGAYAIGTCRPAASIPIGRRYEQHAMVLSVPVAPLAQLAEQRTLNPRVRGSSPWRRTRDQGSDLVVLPGSEPFSHPQWTHVGSMWDLQFQNRDLAPVGLRSVGYGT